MIQLIKGSNIILFNGNTPETVSNVLIGEPSANGKKYTIGIPKGDQHIWCDRKMSFFGRIFRSIGHPEQGIEENIPLSWHKKVNVELAEITGKCTIYEKQTLARHIFEDVYFFDGRGEKTTKTGNEPSEDIVVKIYSFAHDDSYIPKAGDIIVNGECSVIFDTSSQEKVSNSMALFRKMYGDAAYIKTVKAEINGNKHDIVISGR